MKKVTTYFMVLCGLLIILGGCGDKDAEEEQEQTEADTNISEEENDEEEVEDENKDEERDEDKENREEEDEERESQFEDATEDDIAKNNGNNPEDLTELTAMEEVDEIEDKVQDQDMTKDEDLKLREIYGAANASEDIEYDKVKGYYVLELQAGLSNYTSSQSFSEKWVAFALPDGVSVPDVDEIPSGVVVVTLPDGHKGVAVKIPNIHEISSEYVYIDLPLIGTPDDNDPNENLYLYNVDGNAHTAELIGEINATREIDFSVMKD
ncbi:MAG TPA: hypothetical protein VK144_08460 [Bacillota bacterium]|nr:hypothetical protein [Bacillota bacterium]